MATHKAGHNSVRRVITACYTLVSSVLHAVAAGAGILIKTWKIFHSNSEKYLTVVEYKCDGE